MRRDAKLPRLASGLPHQIRKRFGQNFLHDKHVISKIIGAVSPTKNDHILEIGPGFGAITKQLAQSGAKLDCIELDADLAASLKTEYREYKSVNILQADALKFDLNSIATKKNSLRVVGNLPYNISTPLIFHLLKSSYLIRDMTFMLQLEVIQRMVSKVGTKSYGRLGLMVQYYCEVEHLFNIASDAFVPRPKVVSALARLKPHKSPAVTAKDPECLKTVIQTAFNQRRKTIRNSLSTLVSESLLEEIPVNNKLRPENLTLQDYVRISDAISVKNTDL